MAFNASSLLIQTVQTALSDFQTVDDDNASIWQPIEDSPQALAYEHPAQVIGYGGQAGGGKTDLALGLAFTQHTDSVIYRRTFPELAAIIKRGNQIQAGRSSFVEGSKKHWQTDDGRTIELRSVQYLDNWTRQQGQARDLIVFEEAANFTEDMIRILGGWLRTTDANQRTRIVMTFNPPTTVEGEWIVDYFGAWLDEEHPNPAQAGEIRWYIYHNDKDVEVDSGEPLEIDGRTYYPQSRTFIPASLDDNPYLKNDPKYVSQLDALPEPLRSKMRDGNFSIGMSDDEWQVIPTAWVLAAQKRWQDMQPPDVKVRAYGNDPSRGGDDEFVIASLRGTYFDIEAHPGTSAPDGATGAKLVTDFMTDNADVWIDVIGVGASVYDSLKILSGFETHPVNVASRSTAVDKSQRYGFVNIRSQTWWQFREALDPESGENIALPPIRKLRLDLCAPRYNIVGGKYKVESKKDVKKRIQRSTDYGDAILLAWYGVNNTRDIWVFVA